MSPASMSGKICIVTGANSGIGKETALGLAQIKTIGRAQINALEKNDIVAV